MRSLYPASYTVKTKQQRQETCLSGENHTAGHCEEPGVKTDGQGWQTKAQNRSSCRRHQLNGWQVVSPNLWPHDCYPKTRQAQLATQPKRKEAASKVRNMSTKFFYQGTPRQVGHGKANLIKQDKLVGGARCNRVATTGVA